MSVTVDRPARGVASILIDRIDARNAINVSVRDGLLSAFQAAREDPDIRAVVMGGIGGMFSAGGDLPSLVGLSEHAAFARLREGHAIVAELWGFPKPVIAAVERFAVGAGAGLALLADEVVLGRTAFLGFPFMRLGLIPDWGLSCTVARRTGAEAAAGLFAASAAVTADRALELGLADQVVGDAEVMQQATARAIALAKVAPEAFARMKSRLRGDAESEMQLDREARDQASCIVSVEFSEGYAAFRAKREPLF